MVWGGFREGAGRKPSGKRKVNFYITEREEKFLRDCLFSFRTQTNFSGLIEQIEESGESDCVKEGEFPQNLLPKVNVEMDRILAMKK